MANTLPAELTSLTFDGVDLQRSDLSIHFDITKGLNDGLAVRGEDTVVPGLDGQIPRNRKRDHREIELLGRLMGVGTTLEQQLADLQASLDELEEAFAADGSPAVLSGVARDGSTRTILARVISGGFVVGPEEAPGTRAVSVALTSVVPDWTIVEGS